LVPASIAIDARSVTPSVEKVGWVGQSLGTPPWTNRGSTSAIDVGIVEHETPGGAKRATPSPMRPGAWGQGAGDLEQAEADSTSAVHRATER
ncbi:MAG: hypothetical protein WCB63_20610, partial [Polyangiales bacterium]